MSESKGPLRRPPGRISYSAREFQVRRFEPGPPGAGGDPDSDPGLPDTRELTVASAAGRARQMNQGRGLRMRVGEALRGIREPTQQIAVSGTDDHLPQRHARSVIDVGLRIGEAMLTTGASADEVVTTVLRISKAYGLSSTHIDVTYTSITISVHRGLDEDPISVMRIVRDAATDYTRMQNVLRLVEDITSAPEPMDIDEARTLLAATLVRPHPYRKWVVTAGKAILTAGVVVMYDVGWVLVLVAALSAVMVDLISRQLGRWDLPGFFLHIVAASLTTWVAVGLYWSNSNGFEVPGADRPTLIVISGIIMLLSGMALTGAARDGIDGNYVTASARGMEVIMLTLGVAVGIAATLGVAKRLGVPVTVGTSLGPDGGLVWGMIGAAIIGVGFALTTYCEPKVVALAGLVAPAVFGISQFLGPITAQPGIVPGLAGAAAGAIGYAVYRWFQVPEQAITMAGIISLLPGLAVYRALYAFTDSEYAITGAIPAMVVAFATGLGLASGTAIGGYLSRKALGSDWERLRRRRSSTQ